MIEAILRDYLDGMLQVPVYLERPSKLPPSFVVLERTGGGEENYERRAMIAVQSRAPSLVQAAELDELVVRAMRDAEPDGVDSVHYNASYNFTNQLQAGTHDYRYQSIFEVFYHDDGE